MNPNSGNRRTFSFVVAIPENTTAADGEFRPVEELDKKPGDKIARGMSRQRHRFLEILLCLNPRVSAVVPSAITPGLAVHKLANAFVVLPSDGVIRTNRTGGFVSRLVHLPLLRLFS